MTIAKLSRRRVLRGMMGGAAVTRRPAVSRLLSRLAAARRSPPPARRFRSASAPGSMAADSIPGRWEPATVGPNYEFGVELQPLAPFKHKINVYSQMSALLDGRPRGAHTVGPAVILQGTTPPTLDHAFNPEPSIDALIADVIGRRSRFRSLEVSCTGNPNSTHSKRAGSAMNPAEISPLALYTRIFGPEFKDPNAAELHARRGRDGAPQRAVGGQRADQAPHESAGRRRPCASRSISHLAARTRAAARFGAAKTRPARRVLGSAPTGRHAHRHRSGGSDEPIIGCLPSCWRMRWHATRPGCST